MCFSQPKVETPNPPPVPSAESEAAKQRVAAEQATAQQAQGRAATIVTSPLGVSSTETARNRQRVQLSGF